LFRFLNEFSDHPSSNANKLFYNSYKTITDEGACCYISPHLNFLNPATKNMDLMDISLDSWLNIPRGSLHGEFGGFRFILDAESFAFTDTEKHSNGFRIAFADAHDKHLLSQDSYFVSTGEYEYLLDLIIGFIGAASTAMKI
jgi:hypothetical protein